MSSALMQNPSTEIRRLKEEVARLQQQLEAAKDPAGSLISQLNVHDLVAPPAAIHRYYALHMVCTKDGVRHHVIYIGHERRPWAQYAEAIGHSGNAGPRHRAWKFVPGKLREKYEDEGFRMEGEPVLVRSVYGMETVITRHLQTRLPSETVEVAESA